MLPNVFLLFFITLISSIEIFDSDEEEKLYMLLVRETTRVIGVTNFWSATNRLLFSSSPPRIGGETLDFFSIREHLEKR